MFPLIIISVSILWLYKRDSSLLHISIFLYSFPFLRSSSARYLFCSLVLPVLSFCSDVIWDSIPAEKKYKWGEFGSKSVKYFCLCTCRAPVLSVVGEFKIHLTFSHCLSVALALPCFFPCLLLFFLSHVRSSPHFS